MLLRVYRLTDRIGFVILKLIGALTDWLLDGCHVFVQGMGGLARASSHGFGGLFALFIGLVILLYRAAKWLAVTLGRGIRAIAQLIYRFLRLVVTGLMTAVSVVFGFVVTLLGGAARTSNRVARQAGQQAGQSANNAMARRAARAEMDVTVVKDPLKVQNRNLSYLVVLFGFALVGVIYFATDSARTAGYAPIGDISDIGDTSGNSLFLPGTPEAPEQPAIGIGINTPIPTATQIPAALQVRGSIVYTLRERGQSDLWAVNVGDNTSIRITNDIADERDPAWSPDGTRLAYASRQDGNWELYIYDITRYNQPDATLRMTYDLSFQGNPQWSPDGQWLVYESYQGENLDIYAMRIDGSEQPYRITDDASADFSPAWSPDFNRRLIAFVSWRDNNQDIYLFNLDTFEITNLTNTPQRHEDHPAWSPDGRWLAYSAWDQGSEKVFVKSVDNPDEPAQVVSFGRTPSWSPDGNSLTFAVDATDGTQTYLYARPYGRSGGAAVEVIAVPPEATAPTWSSRSLPPSLVNSGGLPLSVTEPLYVEQTTPKADGLIGLQALPDVQAQQPLLSDRVDDSFNALRDAVLDKSGVDLLERLDDAFWDLNRRPELGQERRNWHMTGRAFSFQRDRILGFPASIEIVREDVGVDTYWRVYVRVDDDFQSGQLGEPLRHMPWDFESRTLGGDVEAYNQGGRLKREIPAGYYIDFTQLAADYGWSRRPAGSDWRANSQTIYYWMFLQTGDVAWLDAMLELYTSDQLGGFITSS